MKEIFERAQRVIPGGISTVIRNYPPYFSTSKAEGAYFWDDEGNRYTDYLGAWGPIILGYDNKAVKAKIKEAVDKYDLYGAGVTWPEVQLAEKVTTYVKGAERMLMCGSGSEATYHALRVARAYTGRKKIIKMQGAFHGWHDAVLMNVASEKDRLYKTDPFSDGMNMDVVKSTLICRLNDLNHLADTIHKSKGDIAAVIIDPFCTTFGCFRMHDDYMRGLREICDKEGIVLIYDEVVTGFRLGLGGASRLFDITPDIICMGKAIANGFPVAAIAGKAEIMDCFNTREKGKVAYQATYYGHPVMACAALATIEQFEQPGFYERLDRIGDLFAEGMNEIANRLDIDMEVLNQGSLLGIYFGRGPFNNYDEMVERIDGEKSNEFRIRMIDKKQYIAIGAYKRVVTCAAHTAEDIAVTLQAAEDTLKELYKK
ncbi:MAG: aspartate aminotransferase family protein [Christensenellaceae bacterium]|jgi:glutamate-1-semialdehyde 2,1-aminomutase